MNGSSRAPNRDGRPARARFGSLSRFLDWCQEGGHIKVNPCALVAKSRRPKAMPARAHFLSVVELAKLWRAADALFYPVHRDLSRFLMAVPCRRGEAAALDWTHLNLAGAEWRQPGRMTKNGELHLVVGTAQDTFLSPRSCTSGFLRTYRFIDDGRGLELLHKVCLRSSGLRSSSPVTPRPKRTTFLWQ